MLRSTTLAAAALAVHVLVLSPGCSSTAPIDDPLDVLASTDEPNSRYERAMATLDADQPPSEAYVQALRQMLYRPGYTVRAREAALDRLLAIDPDAALRTLEVQFPRVTALEWRRRVCAIVVERNWTEMTPTLVRAWAFPIAGWTDDDGERPERRALERMYGADELPDLLFALFLESDPITQQNLRARCWEKLVELGERDRLVALLADAQVSPNDATLVDLRAAAVELGVIPVNREEILWVRALRTPERAAYWSEARQAAESLPAPRRRSLEVRDIGAVVAASRTRPELLGATDEALARRIENYLDDPASGRAHQVDFRGWEGEYRQLFQQWRPRLTWSDLLAINLAIDAMAVPQVRAHLFDYADRDLRDRTTEYGGVIRLDGQDRWEVVEFQPRVRGNNERFEAPPDMFEAGYTAVFHFHYHATQPDNAEYAAPAQGDYLYANATRVNALCLTTLDGSRLNVDYYRHGGVSVDLAEIRRP